MLIEVHVDDGATVRDAVAASHILDRIGDDVAALGYAVFGKRTSADARLAEGDRVEITRPLVCDPKSARRRRAERSR